MSLHTIKQGTSVILNRQRGDFCHSVQSKRGPSSLFNSTKLKTKFYTYFLWWSVYYCAGSDICCTTRYHAIACSCARMLIYWSVFQSTIVRLFSCYTERNVNQCILNGSVLRQLTCSTKRYEREREKRERKGQGERESEREASERVCADSTVHPSYVYAKTTNAIYIYIYILA